MRLGRDARSSSCTLYFRGSVWYCYLRKCFCYGEKKKEEFKARLVLMVLQKLASGSGRVRQFAGSPGTSELYELSSVKHIEVGVYCCFIAKTCARYVTYKLLVLWLLLIHSSRLSVTNMVAEARLSIARHFVGRPQTCLNVRSQLVPIHSRINRILISVQRVRKHNLASEFSTTMTLGYSPFATAVDEHPLDIGKEIFAVENCTTQSTSIQPFH